MVKVGGDSESVFVIVYVRIRTLSTASHVIHGKRRNGRQLIM